MTHDDWMDRHRELIAQLRGLHGKRDELTAHSDYIPGPVLARRLRGIEDEQLDVRSALDELVELDRQGLVS